MQHPIGSHARRTLIKDTTGTCRTTSYDLPPKTFVFGKKATGEGEGTKELISELSVHIPSKPAISGQDIVKCNKIAVKNNLITAKDQYDFQLSHQHITKNKNRSSMFDPPEIPFKGPFGVPAYDRPPDESGRISLKPPAGAIEKVLSLPYSDVDGFRSSLRLVGHQ